ncbi:MAG: hypothetical protein Q8Q09_06445 [Deltaproteobacteria bacterium]|nr:hypothetical protein [Deltaproteobacteria bacterium]
MNRLILTAVSLAALSLGGCATSSAAHAHSPVASFGGLAVRAMTLPVVTAEGEPREVQVLVDEPALKLVRIVLRRGTVLPAHSAAVAVTLVALQGTGVVVVGQERLPFDPTHAVALAPNVSHAVEPEAGTELVILVHHLGRGPEHSH